MCSICKSEHPDGCCALQGLWRLAHGGEVLPSNPLEMGVQPPRGRQLVDGTKINREIRATRKNVDNMLKKYEEE